MKLNTIVFRFSAVSALILLLNISPVKGQGRLVESYKAAVWFGIRDVTRDSFPDNDNIDFLNYLHSDREMSEYQYLGLSVHMILRGSWEADLKLAMYDDFAPDNFNFTAQYFPLKMIGITAGIYSYPQYLNYYDTYHKLSDDGFYGDLDPNQRQRKVHETGIMAGPVFKIDYHAFHSLIKLNAGISSLSVFKESFSQKQISGNERRELHYKTRPSPAFFFFPEAEVNIDLLKVKERTLGLQIQSSWFTVNRSVNYSRTTYYWTQTDTETEEIKSQTHNFSKFEFDLGIYLKW